MAGLAGRKGAVVAIEPQTGKVRVMVSIPEYDPNLIPTQFGRLNSDPNKPHAQPRTQELYPPGSTFKVVTATAALDTGKVDPRDDHRRLVAEGDQRRAARQLRRPELRPDHA